MSSSQHATVGGLAPALGPRRWRWRNVPVPEVHVALGIAGLAMGAVRPWRLAWRAAPAVGWPLTVCGAVVAAWAMAAAGPIDLAQPESVVTGGPYAASRHPMYVAWTVGYLGVSLVVRSAWLVASLPLLALLVHRETGREEERLAALFGAEYRAYQARVHRYL